MQVTIPPAVGQAFNHYSRELCRRAGMDRHNEVRCARRIQKHLEIRWQNGVVEGLSNDKAQQRAIESFGNIQSVARSFGGDRLDSTVLYENRRLARLFMFTAYCACVFLMRGILNREPPSIQQKVALFPEFLGKAFVTMAIFYVVVRIRHIGLSIDNYLKVHLFSRMLMKMQTRCPTFYDRWHPVIALLVRGDGNSSVIFKCALVILQFAGCLLAFYLTRNFMVDFILCPYEVIIFHWGHKIPQFESDYYLYMCVVVGMVLEQIYVVLLVASELFEWWQIRLFSNNKYLHLVLYMLPNAMRNLIFPGNSRRS
jgi:hypothetical protein